MRADLEQLNRRLGHSFRDQSLLVRALTHKSHASERSSPGDAQADNEQMEFLGDAILGFLVSEYLVRLYPSFPEGRLSKWKAHMVSENHLHEVAQRLNVGEFLVLGRGEEMSGGREKRALLADALEALIAALHFDGGIEAARSFVVEHVIGPFDPTAAGVEPLPADYKSSLQELAQAMRLPQPRYAIVKEHGPEHSKTFTLEVRLGKEWTAQAEGPSKKAAGQEAAKALIEKLKSPGE